MKPVMKLTALGLLFSASFFLTGCAAENATEGGLSGNVKFISGTISGKYEGRNEELFEFDFPVMVSYNGTITVTDKGGLKLAAGTCFGIDVIGKDITNWEFVTDASYYTTYLYKHNCAGISFPSEIGKTMTLKGEDTMQALVERTITSFNGASINDDEDVSTTFNFQNGYFKETENN